jgi:PHD/YefM family antitoxin component YafN of YafNO toxin-antitoxin module
MVEDLTLSGQPYVITQNGEARMVMESVERYQEKENLVALLKIIAIGEQDRLAGRTQSLEEVRTLLAQDRRDRR